MAENSQESNSAALLGLHSSTSPGTWIAIRVGDFIGLSDGKYKGLMERLGHSNNRIQPPANSAPGRHPLIATDSSIEPANDPERQRRPTEADRATRSAGRLQSRQSTSPGAVAQSHLGTGPEQHYEPAFTNQFMPIEVTVHFESLTTGFARNWRSVIQTWHSCDDMDTTNTQVQDLIYVKLNHGHQNHFRSQ